MCLWNLFFKIKEMRKHKYKVNLALPKKLSIIRCENKRTDRYTTLLSSLSSFCIMFDDAEKCLFLGPHMLLSGWNACDGQQQAPGPSVFPNQTQTFSSILFLVTESYLWTRGKTIKLAGGIMAREMKFIPYHRRCRPEFHSKTHGKMSSRVTHAFNPPAREAETSWHLDPAG